MLCKVAQVFRARGGRPIVLFTSSFSGEESSYILTKYMCTHSSSLLLLVLVILVELPHLAYISAASVMMLIGIGTCLPTLILPIPVSPTLDQTVAFCLLIKIFTS